jgi:hypothetical protein
MYIDLFCLLLIYKVMEDFVGGICVPFHITNVAVICYKGQVIEA